MKLEQLEQLQQQQQHIRELFSQLLHIKNQLIPGQFCLFLPEINASGINDVRSFKSYFANCLSFFDEQIQAQNELIADLPNDRVVKQYQTLQADEIEHFQKVRQEIISQLKNILSFGWVKSLQPTFTTFASNLLNLKLTYNSLANLFQQLIQLQIETQQHPLRSLVFSGSFNANIALLLASTQTLLDYQYTIEKYSDVTGAAQENLQHEILKLERMHAEKEKLVEMLAPAFTTCEKIQEIQATQKKQAIEAVKQRLKERLMANDKDGTFESTRASAKALSCRRAASATCAEPMPTQTYINRRTISARA